MRSGLPADDRLHLLGDQLDAALDAIVESWPRHRSSDHLRLEVAAAFDADRHCSLPSVDAMLAQGVADMEPRTRRSYLDKFMEPSARALGDPVPGCGCPACTGIPADHPVRQRQVRRQQAGHERFAVIVETARKVPLLEVMRRLGVPDPIRSGNSVFATCPLHDDHRPSMSVDTGKGVWYCFVCGLGGDGIALYMKTRRIQFAEAVRELAA